MHTSNSFLVISMGSISSSSIHSAPKENFSGWQFCTIINKTVRNVLHFSWSKGCEIFQRDRPIPFAFPLLKWRARIQL